MATHEPLVAVFDLDGTISVRDTYLDFLLYCLKKRPARWLFTPALPVYFLIYKCGLRSNHWLKARFLRTLAAGIPAADLIPIVDGFVEQTMRDNVKKEALHELKRLRNEGYTLVLATASFNFYVEKLFESLGMDELLCTAAQVNPSGVLTGEIDGKNCIGEEKASRVKSLLVSRGWRQVDRAYSDSIVDLPLLQLSECAFLIDPGPATVKATGEYGYKILCWRTQESVDSGGHHR